MKLARRARSAQPFHAMSLNARAREIEAEGGDVAKLSLGEPDFGAPPGVHEAMRATMDGRPLPYTPAAGLPALRQAVANLYGTASTWTRATSSERPALLPACCWPSP